MRAILPLRKNDAWGSGAYGAPRGNRTHNGIDFETVAGMMILSDIVGVVTKLGYPYADALEYRYVQVTDKDGYDVRYFYVDPIVRVGDEVNDDTIIGVAQDLHVKFDENMTQHVHFEVKKEGQYQDPLEYLDKLATE